MLTLMNDRAAIRILTLLFISLFFLFTRVHGPKLFFIGQGDDESYFSYARTLLFDRDLDFSNEPLATFQGTSQPNISAARYAIGPGLLWTPFLAAAHLMSPLDRYSHPEVKREGIGALHWLMVCAASILYGWASYLLLYLFLRRYFNPSASFWSTVLVGFSSPLLYYLFNRPLMSHSAEFFTLSATAYLVSGLDATSSTRRILITALATGSIFLCRWMDAPYVMALGLWALWNLRGKPQGLTWLNLKQILFTVILGMTGSIQLLVWHYLTGMFYPGIAMFDLGIMKSSVLFSVYPWTARHFVDLWVGKDWGILWTSPVIALTLPALFVWKKWEPRELAKAVLLVPTGITFLVASNWPSHGGEYANRYLIPAWLFLTFLFAEGWSILQVKNRRAPNVMLGLGLIAFVLSLLVLTLFKSNSDSLTLQVGPTLYQLPSDWVNHRYAAEAYHTLVTSPDYAPSTFGASLLGFAVFKWLGALSVTVGPLATYFEKHPAPDGVPLLVMTLFVLIGTLLIARLAMKSRAHELH